MQFNVVFVDKYGLKVCDVDKEVGIWHIEMLQNKYGPAIRPEDNLGAIDGEIRRPPVVDLQAVSVEVNPFTWRDKRLSELFESRNTLTVRVVGGLHDMVEYVPRFDAVHGRYYIEAVIDRAGILSEWIAEGCPLEWDRGGVREDAGDGDNAGASTDKYDGGDISTLFWYPVVTIERGDK